MNLQDELKALKERIAELEELAKDEQEFPQYGDRYWYVSTGGHVNSLFWLSEQFDLRAYEIGNIFKTEEEAEFALEKIKVEAELRKFSSPFKGNNKNYCIELCSPYERVTLYRYEQFRIQGVIYFESREKAQQAIKSVGEERIKKYIFGVED